MDGFHITFVNTDYNHRRLPKSRGHESLKGLPTFRFRDYSIRPTPPRISRRCASPPPAKMTTHNHHKLGQYTSGHAQPSHRTSPLQITAVLCLQIQPSTTTIFTRFFLLTSAAATREKERARGDRREKRGGSQTVEEALTLI